MLEAIETLKNGGVILYPTDTIWGLGCDATNDSACKKILDIKNRPKNKSFIVLVDNFAMLEKFVPEFNEICYDLADLSIKPITIIYPKAKGLASSIIALDGSVGIRITKDPICLNLIKKLKKPIVSTSANISGEQSPIDFNSISDQIKNNVDYIIKKRLNEKMDTPSQIVKIELNGDIQIIRK
tara:strand:+ start:175 stop:723 length:549 start_codon:yes stop_codon:yes gene_type:complete